MSDFENKSDSDSAIPSPEPSTKIKYHEDKEIEIFRRTLSSLNRPRILDLDGLKFSQAIRLNPKQYRLADLITTLVYYHQGIDGVERLQNLVACQGKQHWKEHEICKVGNLATQLVLSAERIWDSMMVSIWLRSTDSTSFFCKKVLVSFNVRGDGAWVTNTCTAPWMIAGSDQPDTVEAFSHVMSQCMLQQIAVVQEKKS